MEIDGLHFAEHYNMYISPNTLSISNYTCKPEINHDCLSAYTDNLTICNLYRCTVHLDIKVLHSLTNALIC